MRVAVLAIGTILGCRDAIGPDRNTPRAPLLYTAPSDSALLAEQSPTIVPLSLTANWDGSYSATTTSFVWKHRTFYTATLSGSVTQSPVAPYNTLSPVTYDLCGAVKPLVRVGIPYNYSFQDWTACLTGNAAFIQIPPQGFVNIMPAPGYNAGNCHPYPMSNRYPCWSFSGGYTGSMNRVEADLTLTLTSDTISAGSSTTVA